MKKLIVLLLAFAMVGAVSAQVTTAVALSGAVKIVDEAGSSIFAPNGAGYDTLTLKAQDKDAKYGFSVSDSNFLPSIEIGSWNVWYKPSAMFKVVVGNFSNSDFRTSMNGLTYSTGYWRNDNIAAGYNVLVEAFPMDGLTLGVNLPFSNVAKDTVDVLQSADLGAKYVLKDLGTLTALFNVDLVTPANKLAVGFKFTAVENVTAFAIFDGAFDANTYKVGLGGDYSGIDKLWVGVEGSFLSTAGTASWDVNAEADYDVTDNVYAILYGAVGSGSVYDVDGTLGYSFGNGLKLQGTLGYADTGFFANAKLKYGISF